MRSHCWSDLELGSFAIWLFVFGSSQGFKNVLKSRPHRLCLYRRSWTLVYVVFSFFFSSCLCKLRQNASELRMVAPLTQRRGRL